MLNVGLLNFSIHLNEHNKSYPSIDLRSSIHDIHLKTCYDGAEVLAQLIAYIANDKDLKTNMDNANNSKKTDITPVRNVDHANDKTVNQINTLMADAVKDMKTLSVSQPLEKFDESPKVENESLQGKPILSNMFDFDQIFDSELQPFYKYDTTENSFVNDDLGATSINVAPTLEEFHIIHDDDILFMVSLII